MKQLDERGRLFGLFNLIDILVLLLVIAGIFFFYQRYGTAPQEAPVEEGKAALEVVILSKYNEPFVKDSLLNDPPELKNLPTGQYFGKIENIEVQPAVLSTRNQEGINIAAPDSGRYNLILTVRCEAVKSGKAYFAGGQAVKIGDRLRLYSPCTYIEGYPVRVQPVK
jgi:hypothetical protein